MIQLYKLGKGMERINLTAPSLSELYNNLDLYLSKLADVGIKENVFYTVHDSGAGDREFKKCTHLMFDIDHCDMLQWEKYLQCIIKICGNNKNNWTVINSGHGLHFLAELEDSLKWSDESLFNQKKLQYRNICGLIASELRSENLSGEVDTSIFDRARIFRMPGTINKKQDKPPVKSALLTVGRGVINTDLEKITGVSVKTGAASKTTPKREEFYGDHDEEYIVNECAAIAHARENPSKTTEPVWYAIDSILGRFKNNSGRTLIHQWSKDHPSYSEEQVNKKIDQALEASGPRTCEHFNTIWDGCKTCPHFGKVKSPIQLQGPNFIATASNGYHNITVSVTGAIKREPNYEDMTKEFKKEKGAFIALAESRGVMTWNGTHYSSLTDTQVESFAFTRFNPRSSKLGEEFKKQLFISQEIKTMQWFKETTEGKLNLINGVLDLKTTRLTPHGPGAGFRSLLGFAYDPTAKCPTFDKFIKDITCNDTSLENALLEFITYAIAGERCVNEKVLVLTGEGANGKTTFVEIFRKIFGAAMVDMAPRDFSNNFNLVGLDGALACFIEETPAYKDRDFWEMLKKFASGGNIRAAEKHKPAYQFENRAKFILTCNILPGGTDASHGYYRRMLIVPFNATFDAEARDLTIRDRIIKDELPGILNRILTIYKELSKNDFKIREPEASVEAMEQYMQEHDTVLSWCSEFLRVVTPDEMPFKLDAARTPVNWAGVDKESRPILIKRLVHAAYVDHCRQSGQHQSQIANDKHFWRRFRVIYKKYSTVLYTQIRLNGEREHVVVGATRL